MRWGIFLITLILGLLLLLFACTVTPFPEDEPKEITPKSSFPNEMWTNHTYDVIKNSLLVQVKAKDEKEFCPNGMNAHNWLNLFSTLAYYESSYKPETEYKENFKNSKGEWVISTGLFQLSLESARAYKCPMNSQADLKDPIKNIDCAVVIAERWVTRDGVIYGKSGSQHLGMGRYWGPFRRKLDKIKERLKPHCI